jgi:hypothetical protein
MTNKDIAGRLREIIAYQQDTHIRMEELADELDPPYSEPGTVVWWRYVFEHDVEDPHSEWFLGIIANAPRSIHTQDFSVDFSEVEWKPARILADDEVAVTVPPKFPDGSDEASLRWHYDPNDDWMTDYAGVSITRAEAEAREAQR